MNLGNELAIEQRQILSQRQRQSLQILACNNQELDDLMTGEYMENPMLEYTGSQQEDFFTSFDVMWEKSTVHTLDTASGADEHEQRGYDILSDSFDLLKKEIFMQVDFQTCTAKECRLYRLLIDYLDSSGFFPWDTDEIAHLIGYPQEIIERCLNVLRQFEPIGIFSKNLSECLLKQLEYEGCEDQILKTIVREHLNSILKGQLSHVSRTLGLSTASVRKYLLQIGKLNPRPIMNAQETQTQYIVPDLVAAYKDGQWEIAVNDNWKGRYQLNQDYMNMMMKSNDRELEIYFRSHLERARFMLNCVERRRTTILNITREIIYRQQPYFLNKGGLKPMTMEQVAEVLRIHTSTVSRAVRNKYLQFQYGTVPMKDLFAASSVIQKNSEEDSVTAVYEKLRDLVRNEDKSAPYSDLSLVRELDRYGMHISRRTIAKYRMEMGIPNSDQRRYFM